MYDSKQHAVVNLEVTTLETDAIAIEGSDPFELVPDMENYIIFAAGDIKRATIGEIVYNDSMYVSELSVVPRWGMM